jgi:hypothetical protein
MANDVAVTDAVVASEITRLRMKVRENSIIFASEHGPSLPAWISTASLCVSSMLWHGHPNEIHGGSTKPREHCEHALQTPRPQLKTDLEFRTVWSDAVMTV